MARRDSECAVRLKGGALEGLGLAGTSTRRQKVMIGKRNGNVKSVQVALYVKAPVRMSIPWPPLSDNQDR